MRRSYVLALLGPAALASAVLAQTPKQPKVAPGPNEPDWDVVLKEMYGLSMFGDLKNPVSSTPRATPGLFKKAGPGPVTYTPEIALGLETKNRGGWYTAGADDKAPARQELWSYVFKNTTDDFKARKNMPPPLSAESKTSFDPANRPFGVWISNDGLADSLVYTQPALVAANNSRLAKQPYKAMIYPNRDKATGKPVPHSYIIGFEYSTNDDFQDIVCRLDNVELLEAVQAPGGEK